MNQNECVTLLRRLLYLSQYFTEEEGQDLFEARRILRRLEFHFTPKHASWLNMAEIELSVYSRSLPEHLPNDERLAHQVQALTEERNENQRCVDWQFRTTDARIKLKRLYPSISE